LTNRDYIVLDGLTISSAASDRIALLTSTNITIQNCTIGPTYNSGTSVARHIDIATRQGDSCSDIKILNNTFLDETNNIGYNANPDINYRYRTDYAIQVGRAQRVLIEGNIIGTVGHSAIYVAHNTSDTSAIVIRDNDIINKWHYGISVMRNTNATNILIENNRLSDMGTLSDLWTSDANPFMVDFCKEDMPLYLETKDIIVRRNIIWDSESAAFNVANGYDVVNTHGFKDGRVYHNTVYSHKEQAVTVWNSNSLELSGNNYINNIFAQTEENDTDCCSNALWHEGEGDETDCSPTYQPASPSHPYEIAYALSHANASGWDDWWDYNIFTPGNTIHYQKVSTSEVVTIGAAGLTTLSTTFSDEWGTNNISGTPTFVNAGADNFNLASGSIGIDSARYLTLVNDSGGGSGTSMVVDDATWFYDGWGIAGETADTIYVDNPTSADFEVQISSITGNTIELESEQTWEDNAEVYHCPDGVCFNGSAPDIGALEYTGGSRVIIINN
jgi:hypothetical protein